MVKNSVSLRDVYDAVNNLEEKIDRKFEKFEDRVQNLESFRDRTFGFIAGVGGLFGTISSLIVNFIFETFTKK